MPLYRRGPGFLAAQLNPPAWSLRQAYGPPDDREAAGIDLDLRLFSVYFLVAESLATFVGYRITQHCLRGCRVWFLSPSARMWIGFFYCSLKISLIDYAFHGSAYFTGTLCIMLLYAVNAVMALGFHLGPLQFLFFDYIPKHKMTQSLYHRMTAVCQQVSSRLEFYALQRWLALPPVLDESNVVVPSASLVANGSRQAPASVQSPPSSGFSRVNGFFGRELVVNISQWNLSVCAQWTPTLITSGRCAATALESVSDAFETRFLFMMQHDGLLLGFILMSPTATLMIKLRESGNAVPFEIVLRFHCRCRSDVGSSTPLFLYAHSAVLFGGATPAQSVSIYELLRALNGATGRTVDVPLRSLRRKNFIDAGVGRIVKKKARRQGILSEMDSNSFL